MEQINEITPSADVALENDRGIPSVASSNKSSKKMALILVVIGITIFGLSAISKINAKKSVATEDTENKYYGRGLSDLPAQPNEDEESIGTGYAINPPPEAQQITIAEPERQSTQRRNIVSESQHKSRQPAQYKPAAPVRESDAERWERRAGVGSTVAYDGGNGSAQKKSTPGGEPEFDINAEMQQLNALSQGMGGSMPGMPDMSQLTGQQVAAGSTANPNTQFANDARGQIVEKAMAMPMGDMEHMIVQGKVVPCTLETAVDSSLPGQVRCIVNRDIYGESGRTVLIERGTRAVGQYNSAIQNGQYRIFMIWTRLINQKYDIAIGSPSTDSLGRAGSAGDVEGHFWKRFGNATLLSLLGAGTATYGTDGAQTAANAYRQSITNQFSAQANTSLAQGGEIPDTIHLDQGENIKIMVARDLDFGFMAKSGGL